MNRIVHPTESSFSVEWDCPFRILEDYMAKRKSKFMCKSCGYESPKWMGRCPGCGEWNTMNEEVEIVQKGPRGAFQHTEVSVKRRCRLVQLKR